MTRTQRRTAEMRQAIIVAAEELLVEQGQAALTNEKVAERADVSVQTVYNRVGGKSALLIAIAEKALEANRAYMDSAYAADGTPEQRIRRAGEAYVRFATDKPHQFQILANPPDEPDAVGRVAELLREQNGKLAAALRDGIDAGAVDPRIEPDTAASALWAMMNGALTAMLRTDDLRPPPTQVDNLMATAMTIIENGLRATENES
ncbi:TetR family transcriptional regulator [Mycobacterium colombiense]|uniref:TetR family transcriptional regulator n=1 Tax=Mycobacterium colombiense TaxID=339268 RepID=A0A1A2YS99_9MYCO|nr:TetR family transcriptional regulator [Mycobacterium colombiense]